MRKRNHKMHRRTINASATDNAIANSQPTRAEEVSRVMVLVRLSYEKLKAGHAADFDFDRVGAAINVGLVRAESIDLQLVETFKKAGEAMLQCARRQRQHGKYGFAGMDLLAMNYALDLYQQALSLSSPNQMQAAALEAQRRLAAGEVFTPEMEKEQQT